MSSPPVNEFLRHFFRLLIIGGSVALLIFCVWSAAEARKTANNRVADWLPEGTEELKVFRERYYRHFPEGEYLMVSWKDCDIDDEHLDEAAEKLITPPTEGAPPYFARVMTTRSVMEALMDSVPQLNREGAKSRLAGWLIGQDQKTACLVLVPHPQGWKQSAKAVEFLLVTVEQITGLPRSDIHIAGTGIDSVAINEISAKSQRTLLPFFLLFSLFLLLCCLRNFFAALLVFWVAMINEELAGTLLYWTGAHVDSISMLISSLAYVLTISGSVHLMNYYRETLAEMEPGEEKNAPMQTFCKAIFPCSLATFTTIMGMGSLGISGMIPIKTFGIYASLTLFLGTIWFFLCILAVLQERPIRRWFPETLRSEVPETPRIEFLEHFGLFIFQWRMPITICTFLLLAVFATGIKDLRTSVTFHGLLPKEAKVLQDYHALEDQIGGLIPIEVVVHFPDGGAEGSKALDQLYLLEALVAELQQANNVEAIISALNFVPNLPPQTGGGLQAVGMRAATEGRLKQNQDSLRDLRFFDVVAVGDTTKDGNVIKEDDPDVGHYWRISLRVAAQKRLNYSTVIKEVNERIEKVRQARQGRDSENVRVDVTGGVPLVFRAQELLLWDLINSFAMAFCLIALTMIIVLRGIVRGLLAMIPNVFPCVIVFGILGLFGIPVDMGSMMTASVALGISVDGTLHLLTWVNIGLRRGLHRKDAVFYALHRCSAALLQTTIICGVGMLVFGWSDFVPVSRFAILLFTILMVALASAVVALPAILFSPLGRFFESGDKDKNKKWLL